MANLAIPALLGLASYMTRNKQQEAQAPAANRTDNTQIMGANQDAEDMEAGQAPLNSQPTAIPGMSADQNQSQAEVNRLMGQDANASGVPVSPTVMAQKNPSFKQAFAQARLDGKPTFPWNGKTYTTELASAKPMSAPSVIPGGNESAAETARLKTAEAKAATRPAPTTKAEEKPKKEPEVAKTKTKYVRNASGKMVPVEDTEPVVPTKTKPMINPRTGREMSKGGNVKKFAKGGSVSSRGDGIAKKGHTKGRMV
jgi:hypothetical protein